MKSVRTTLFSLAMLPALVLLCAPPASSHCQIPCGIYDDQMRFDMIAEHITTIEKSIKEIVRLEKAAETNYNQIVRWVNNKDQHADEIADIVSDYFLAQRVKPLETTDEQALHDYGTKLELLHQMIFYAMKTKQTTDLQHVATLHTLLEKFHQAYFTPKAEKSHKH